jgi:hypothetical protein
MAKLGAGGVPEFLLQAFQFLFRKPDVFPLVSFLFCHPFKSSVLIPQRAPSEGQDAPFVTQTYILLTACNRQSASVF